MSNKKLPDNGNEHFGHPKGTAIIMAIFLLLILILWGSVYLIMLSRGVTFYG
ncbi:MAG TPA: cytochrome c oxidase subunit 2A [Anaerolineae bacterium]|nr:cytochrome c oxidase subunit 2A [Anaerolineae bacterium]